MTVGEIRKKIIVKANSSELSDKYDIFLDIRNKIRTDLLNYYSTEVGRQEIDDSPHRGLSTEEAVDLLMQDVDIWINKELGINAEITE
jgi:hypothetical protein